MASGGPFKLNYSGSVAPLSPLSPALLVLSNDPIHE